MKFINSIIGRNPPFDHIICYDELHMERLSECPACGVSVDKNAINFSEIDRYGFPTNIQRCGICDLFFVNPRPVEAEYANMYNSGKYRKLIHALSGKDDDHKMPQKRVMEVVSFLKPIVAGRPLKILNIGGTPSDYYALKDHLQIERYVCVNPGLDEAGSGYEVWPTSFERCDKESEVFDLICLFGTINHLLDPKSVFLKVSKFMNKKSIFVFDYKDPINKMERMRYPTSALQFDHSTYPTFKTLGILMDKAKLELISSQTLNKRLYTFAAKKSDKPKLDPLFEQNQLANILRLARSSTWTPKRLILKSILSFVKHKIKRGAG